MLHGLMVLSLRTMTLMAEDKSTGGDEQLTIDQLAQRTGMTVRNIRAHQSRGLLPRPPCARGPATTGPITSLASS